jgi:hypothetical protein
MLSPDTKGICQKEFDYLEEVCSIWMQHYNFMLSNADNEIDAFFYREHFNEVKWYDV